MEIANLFYKEKSSFVINGKTALSEALKLLNSKVVAIPTYTCSRVYEAVVNVNCEPIIVDCNYFLQIKTEELYKYDNIDTVIVPHMFGIQALKEIKLLKKMGYKIIEDCSQCMGLPELGKYSDIVIASLGPTKWLPVGLDKENGGGLIAYNKGDIKNDYTHINKAINMFSEIDDRLKIRKEKIQEFQNAGVKFIGSERPNAWLRGIYITEKQKRIPYTPLHDIYKGFKCPTIDNIKNKIDWISVFA
tara:strand:+ start:2832 stop:3569 length:738 start_codon:yes stop_codon:yes gene_type:complete